MPISRTMAVCSCFASFNWDVEGDIDRMNRHITDNNYMVHQWVYVPDVLVCEELRRVKDQVDVHILAKRELKK